jgi:hypothetical protein
MVRSATASISSGVMSAMARERTVPHAVPMRLTAAAAACRGAREHRYFRQPLNRTIAGVIVDVRSLGDIPDLSPGPVTGH